MFSTVNTDRDTDININILQSVRELMQIRGCRQSAFPLFLDSSGNQLQMMNHFPHLGFFFHFKYILNTFYLKWAPLNKVTIKNRGFYVSPQIMIYLVFLIGLSQTYPIRLPAPNPSLHFLIVSMHYLWSHNSQRQGNRIKAEYRKDATNVIGIIRLTIIYVITLTQWSFNHILKLLPFPC